MPIGSSKSGVMGAGITPGGSEVFNSSGTFTAPAGITTVNITGTGGAGNSGGSGNSGNPGQGGNGSPGNSGGAGGGGGNGNPGAAR